MGIIQRRRLSSISKIQGTSLDFRSRDQILKNCWAVQTQQAIKNQKLQILVKRNSFTLYERIWTKRLSLHIFRSNLLLKQKKIDILRGICLLKGFTNCKNQWSKHQSRCKQTIDIQQQKCFRVERWLRQNQINQKSLKEIRKGQSC